MLKKIIKKNVRRIEKTSLFSKKIEENYYSLLSLLNKDYGLSHIKRTPQLIVSLTSYGNRVNSVRLVIETLFGQFLKADKIILWLSEEEFSDSTIPESLKNLKHRGLEIEYTKDIGSYKKLIPTLRRYPDSVIVTADDDMLYPSFWLSELWNSYLETPHAIHCHQARTIRLKRGHSLAPYSKWDYAFPREPSFFLLPIGCQGILYPPGCLDEEVFNEEAFISLCRNGDDIWFKAMSLKSGTKVKVVENSSLEGVVSFGDTQYSALYKGNVLNNQNDYYINNVFERYGLVEYLKQQRAESKDV